MAREPISVMVVENDYFLASKLASEIRQGGDHVIGPFDDIHDAINCTPLAQVAILNIGSSDDFAVADSLLHNEIPFVFLTGCGCEVMPRQFRDQHIYTKPTTTPIMLADLHAQHAAIEAQRLPSIETVVHELLGEARALIRDPGAAERLVESVLKQAIAHTHAGLPGCSRRQHLQDLLREEYRLHRRRHLS
ncbi:hypothetical protein [Paracoccus sp. DMF]|uniref:hypothetical protein n=1 Tax=Paracoccus sp. DMF TaxID=400837 RepID=UPI0011018A4C|nr:hypothetical protein [Paracoccus sp. DMF]MCV2449210.1 hypothetical protein [Paracoccus sp. DMF]